MKRRIIFFSIGLSYLIISGCVAVSKPTIIPVEPNKPVVSKTIESQPKHFIKRTVAIGRFTNETNYGKGFFDKSSEQGIGRQAMDILSARLAASEKFIMLEREDMDLINSLNSTSKCNFLFPKEYIIGCFKSKTFPWPII